MDLSTDEHMSEPSESEPKTTLREKKQMIGIESDEDLIREERESMNGYKGPSAEPKRPSLDDLIEARDQQRRGTKRRRIISTDDIEKGPDNRVKIPRLLYTVLGTARGTIRDLIHEELDLVKHGARYPNSTLPESQVGLTVWTQYDKNIFFNALAVYGKDNLSLIAKQVNKSIPQIQEYLLLLETATREFTETYGPPLRLDQVPAAIEIPQNVEWLLDSISHVMEEHIQLDEEKEDQAKFGSLAIFDGEFAKRVQQAYHDEDGYEPADDKQKDAKQAQSLLDEIPALNLVHLPNMLHLSRKIFMRKTQSLSTFSVRSHDLSPIQIERAPSIRQVAFEDFHTLVISLTKRLVSTVLFQAKDRIRSSVKETKAYVMPVDVANAIDILGLPHNSFEYWIKMPRRLGLTVAPKGPRSKFQRFEMHLPQNYLSYDQVESALLSGIGVREKYQIYMKTRKGGLGVVHEKTESMEGTNYDKNDAEDDGQTHTESDVTEENEDSDLKSSESEESDHDISSQSEVLDGFSTDDSEPEANVNEPVLNMSSTRELDSDESMIGSITTGVEDTKHAKSDTSSPAEEVDVWDRYAAEAAELEKIDQIKSKEYARQLCKKIGLDCSALPQVEDEPQLELLVQGLDSAGSWRSDMRHRTPWEESYTNKSV